MLAAAAAQPDSMTTDMMTPWMMTMTSCRLATEQPGAMYTPCHVEFYLRGECGVDQRPSMYLIRHAHTYMGDGKCRWLTVGHGQDIRDIIDPTGACQCTATLLQLPNRPAKPWCWFCQCAFLQVAALSAHGEYMHMHVKTLQMCSRETVVHCSAGWFFHLLFGKNLVVAGL